MALYDPTEKKAAMTSLTFRLPDELIEEMDATVRLWRMFAAARGDEVRGIDRSYVMRKFLREGRDQAFAEFGGIPRDEAGWAKLEQAILKAVKKSR